MERTLTWMLLAMASLAAGELLIGSESQTLVLSPGEDTKVPCLITGEGFNMWYNPIKWFKLTPEGEVEMNSGAVMNEPYLDTGRYTLKPEEDAGDDVDFSLNIAGVTIADNGTYRCELWGRSPEPLSTVTHKVIVPTEVRELTLFTNVSRTEEVGNGSKTFFEFDKLEPTFVNCVSKGGNPKPTLKMMRGRKDVTEEFEHAEEEVKSGPKGLEQTEYVVRLTRADFMADESHSGHNLKCLSKVPRSGKGDKLRLHKQTRVAEMVVKYAPEFDCERDWSAFLETEQFTIECSVHANPQVELDTISWRLGETDNATQLNVGQSLDGMSANISVDRETEKVKVVLTIDQVNSTHLQTYTLKVRNSLGERHFQAKLSLATTTLSTTTAKVPYVIKTERPGNPKEVVQGSAEAWRAGLSLCLTLALAALLSSH